VDNTVFQFSEAHLAEIGVGGTESNLHDIHLVFPEFASGLINCMREEVMHTVTLWTTG
jgi:hypothetical protein